MALAERTDWMAGWAAEGVKPPPALKLSLSREMRKINRVEVG